MLFIAGRTSIHTATAIGKGLKFHVTPTKIEHTSSLMVVASRFIGKILLNNNIKIGLNVGIHIMSLQIKYPRI